MMNWTIKTVARGFLPALLCTLGLSSVSWGAEFWLRAETLTKSMPDASVITMWGFAECTTGFASCTPATVPGPRLTVPVGDSVLTINLRNNLTGPLVEPVSIVIPGQTIAATPVRNPDGRVRSFTTETPADNATTGVYSWTDVKPGTYLYQSGSHPALQVQMGLYGAVTNDFAAGQAYGPSTAYTTEAMLLFSEIDPVLHGHVAAGSYGQPPPGGIPSTFNYEPKYFLINGAPYSASSSPIAGGSVGGKVLLRFLNAGLKSHVPVLQGLDMSIVAEDGNTYGFAKLQYSLLLPAGKTTDVIVTPATFGSYALYDRRLALTNGAVSGGGMLAHLSVAPASATGLAVYGSAAWYIDANGNGLWDGTPTDQTATFGFAGAVPVSGAWNGSGTALIGVYDPASFLWYIDYNGNGVWDGTPTDQLHVFGFSGTIPVTGDWSGTGTTKIGVYHPASNTWYLDYNGNGIWDPATDRSYQFSAPGAIPVTGDWDGSGITKIGVYNSATTTWSLDYNNNGTWDGAVIDRSYVFGSPGALPVTGDWDNSGITRIGFYAGAQWYLDLNGNGIWNGAGTDALYNFGFAGATPVTGRW